MHYYSYGYRINNRMINHVEQQQYSYCFNEEQASTTNYAIRQYSNVTLRFCKPLIKHLFMPFATKIKHWSFQATDHNIREPCT